KEKDPEYWRWLYLGDVVGLGDMVYNMKLFQWIDQLPEDDDLLLIDIAIDSGYQTSATTFLAFELKKKDRMIILVTYYNSQDYKARMKTTLEISRDMWEFYWRLTK